MDAGNRESRFGLFRIMKPFLLSTMTLSLLAGCRPTHEPQNATAVSPYPYERTESEWRKKLTPEQYRILREKGTEYPGTGVYNLHFEAGTYSCAGCGTALFSSESKFDSHCGWPSFDAAVAAGVVEEKKDTSHGMIRTEILCASCGGHLGHVFPDGPTETGLRYCVNSLSLDFQPSGTSPSDTTGIQ